MVTFTGESVHVEASVDAETGEAGAFVLWNGATAYDVAEASVEDAHFVATWGSIYADLLPCPATGATYVVTRLQNLWVGDAEEGGFQSTLFQQVDTDCGTHCFLTWELAGESW